MKKKILQIISCLLLMVVILITSSNNIKALSDDYYTIDLKTTTTTISSGSEIRLSVDLAFSSLTSDYSNAKIEVLVPSELVGATMAASDLTIAYSDGSTGKIAATISGNKISYITPTGKKIEPGYAATIDLIKVTTQRYVTLPGIVNFKATISATTDQGAKSLEDTQAITINVNRNFLVNKTAQFPNYNNGGYVRFRMFISSPNQTGALGGKSFVVKDKIPTGLTFVAFDDPNDPNITLVKPGLIPGDNSTWAGAKAQPFSNIPASYPAGNVTFNSTNNEVVWNVNGANNVIYNNNSYLEVTFWAKIDDNFLGASESIKLIENKADLETTYIDNTTNTHTNNGNVVVIKGLGDARNIPNKDIYFKNGGYGDDANTVYYKLATNTFRNETTK
ncbi:MAG: hypothetical protein ACRCTA_03275, partial [Bacilli bacterium]